MVDVNYGFKCKSCGKTFTSGFENEKDALKCCKYRHIEEITKEYTTFFKCKKCDEEFRNENDALKCCKDNYIEECFECDECGEIYSNEFEAEECCEDEEE